MKTRGERTMAYTLILDNCGNPDRGQDPDRRVHGTERLTVKVKDFEEASKAALAYIEENGLGMGNWIGGVLRDGRNREIGYVGYNGIVYAAGRNREGRNRLWPEHLPEAAPAVRKPDPYELEKAIIETPFGPLTLQGSFGRCSVGCGSKGFVFQGETCSFNVWLDIDENGYKGGSNWLILREGTVGERVNPALVEDMMDGIFRDWASEPENMALLVRNTIKERRREIGNLRSQMARLQDEIEARSTEAGHLEDVLAGITDEGPKPR
jgi:hypothetical protein